jgi:long-chain acyl-CoA synthetase
VDVRDTDVFLGVLPLAHVYELLAESASMLVGEKINLKIIEQNFEIFNFSGVGIGYSTPLTLLDTSAKIMTGTLGDSRVLMPTVMTAVPLILDRVRKGITDKMSKESAIKRELFNYCLKYKARWVRRGFRTPIVDAVVFKKVAALLGGRMRAMISGGLIFLF